MDTMNVSNETKPRDPLFALAFKAAFYRNQYNPAAWMLIKPDGQLLASGDADSECKIADMSGMYGKRKKIAAQAALCPAGHWRAFDNYSIIVRF
jgi:hypothetical protein